MRIPLVWNFVFCREDFFGAIIIKGTCRENGSLFMPQSLFNTEKCSDKQRSSVVICTRWSYWCFMLPAENDGGNSSYKHRMDVLTCF